MTDQPFTDSDFLGIVRPNYRRYSTPGHQIKKWSFKVDNILKNRRVSENADLTWTKRCPSPLMSGYYGGLRNPLSDRRTGSWLWLGVPPVPRTSRVGRSVYVAYMTLKEFW